MPRTLYSEESFWVSPLDYERKNFLILKIPAMDMSWVFQDNQGIIGPIQKIGRVHCKRHRIYERQLTH